MGTPNIFRIRILLCEYVVSLYLSGPLNISLITDYDAGLVADCEPVSHEAVMEVFANNISKLQKLLFSIVENIDENKTCECDNVAKW